MLVDDLVVECPREPYRMFTSRAEYRLLLRSDNADRRLMAIGHRLGLIPDAAYRRVEKKKARVVAALEAMKREHYEGKQLLRILRQPERRFAEVADLCPRFAPRDLSADEATAVEIEAKYAAYIERQLVQIERLRRMEERRIPSDFDYSEVMGVRSEAREKLSSVRPRSLGQASRISGVTPADLNVLLVYLESLNRKDAS